ncbi:HlyD family secretion protein [Brevibacillus ginsengisoli]|uniref:HlyD family secretion protein n=1 Tax=Brevibacillus ginsengisoli TaxID=363854 RepID=UPI003CEE850F
MKLNAKSWAGIIGFVAVTGLLGAYLLVPGGKGYAGADKPLVSVVEGTEVDMAFKMAGAVDQVMVKEGDVVAPNQVLATLTTEELNAKREQAEAAYKLAQAKFEQAKRGVVVTDDTTQAQVQQTMAAVNAAKAQYDANLNGARPEEIVQLTAKEQAAQIARDNAKTNLQRMNDLYAQGAVPKVNVEQATTQFNQIDAELSAVQQQLKMAKSGPRKEQVEASKAQWQQAQAAYQQAVAATGQGGIKQMDVKQAEAGVQQAKGALDEVDAYLRNTKLNSPVAGIVKSVNVEKGELVAQGLTIVTIQAKDDQFVKFYVDEDKLGKVQVGQKHTFFVPALNQKVEGTIVTVAPAADFAVKKATQELNDRDIRAFEVKVQIHGEGIRPGLSVEWDLKGDGVRE